MNKDLVEVVFIIDESGSMSGLEADTIGGFNSTIERQREISLMETGTKVRRWEYE